MGSRTRVAAAACLVASGLLVSGAATVATAVADPGSSPSEESSTDSPLAGAGTRGGGTGAGPEGGAGDATDRSGKGDDQTGQEIDGSDGLDDLDDLDGLDGLDGLDDLDGLDGTDDLDVDGADDLEDLDGLDDAEGLEDLDDLDDADELDAAGSLIVAGDPPGEEKEPRWPCCADGDDDCGGWPWPWPWPGPDPEEPVGDSSGGGDYGGGLPAAPPALRPLPGGASPPELVPPSLEEPPSPDVIDVVPGAGLPTTGSPGAPVSLPLVVPAPAAALPVPRGAPGGGGGSGVPAAPRQATAAPPAARQPLPASTGSTVGAPASSYRVGYAEYLRTAGVSQIAALALPGLTGIFVLTCVGGLVGYRQAKAGHVVRPGNAARFMN